MTSHIKMGVELLVFLVSVSVVGCNRTPWAIDKTRDRLQKLEFNMSESDVVEVMGKPHKNEAFFDQQGNKIQVLIYETEYTHSGPVTDSAFTPVLLRSGRVIGWGRNMYDRTKRYHVEVDIKNDAQ